jgi:hypothetical protein
MTNLILLIGLCLVLSIMIGIAVGKFIQAGGRGE